MNMREGLCTEYWRMGGYSEESTAYQECKDKGGVEIQSMSVT